MKLRWWCMLVIPTPGASNKDKNLEAILSHIVCSRPASAVWLVSACPHFLHNFNLKNAAWWGSHMAGHPGLHNVLFWAWNLENKNKDYCLNQAWWLEAVLGYVKRLCLRKENRTREKYYLSWSGKLQRRFSKLDVNWWTGFFRPLGNSVAKHF